MRAVLYALVASLIGLGVPALTISAGDRDVLVSPPEVVAEEFTRSVAGGRYDPARKDLSDEVRAAIGTNDLQSLRSAIEGSAGDIETIEGEPGDLGASEATASVQVKGDAGSASLSMQLRHEHGEWKIVSWSF